VIVKGRIVTRTEVFCGSVLIENGRIVDIGAGLTNRGGVYDFGESLVVPGFIDVHMHGLGEFGVFSMAELTEVARMETEFGTTGFLPSAASLTEEQYLQFGGNVREAQKLTEGKTSRIIGAHFEGPFINPERKGGMDAAFLRRMDVEECRRYIENAGDVLKVMTLSPELNGSEEVIKLLHEHNVVVSLGHSRATEADINRAIECGLSQVCHLFNTFMRVSEIEAGRLEQGLIECVLIGGELNCEVTCDLHHVSSEYIKLAAKMLGPERFIAITDSLPGAGLGSGEYNMVDGRKFVIQDGTARLASDGTLVGSILTMNKAFGNLVEKCDIELVDAVKFTSSNPARAMGLEKDCGAIETGRCADIAVLDAYYNCIATFVGGQMVYGG